MIEGFFLKYKVPLKWIGIAFLIKTPLFIFFALQFNQYWPADRIVNGIFAASGDTGGYYGPCEDFVNGAGYSSFCRMPGLLPVYALLRLLFNTVWTKTFIIIFQFIASTVSVYILSRIAEITFKNRTIFLITFYLYAFSSFVSIWAHVGYADTFGIAFLIFSIYFLVRFKESKLLKELAWAGIFITWSVFFRPVHGVVLPLLVLIYLLNFKQIAGTLKHIIIFSLPVVLCLGLWTVKNYKETGKVIVLQGPLYVCFPGITEEMISIRHLIEAWGGDTQPWSTGSAGEWFFAKKEPAPGIEALNERKEITSVYNGDSLLILRKKYSQIFSDTIPIAKKNALKHAIMSASARYTQSYRHEKPLNYFLVSRLKLVKLLVFSKRLDDLPFPKFNEMKWYHKVIKGFYFLLLLMVNFLGLIGCFLALKQKSFLALIPLVFVTLLGAILGYAEQRYITPVYPFFVIYTAYLLVLVRDRFKRAFNKTEISEIN